MGVLQRFERRLEGLVEGAFARAFKGNVEPVEIAAALEREALDKKAIVGAGRVLVPNAYVVQLGQADYARLSPYARQLGIELATMVQESATEQQWSFVGDVAVTLERVDDLETGVFHIRSNVVDLAPPRRRSTPRSSRCRAGRAARSAAARGSWSVRTAAPRALDRATPLVTPVTIIGRGHDAAAAAVRPGRLAAPRPGRAARRGGLARGPGLDQRHHPRRRTGHRADRDDQRAAHRHGLERAGVPSRPGRLLVQNSTVPDLAIFGIRIGLLALLWLFVLAAVRVMRHDLTGNGQHPYPRPPCRRQPPSRPSARRPNRPRARRSRAGSWSPPAA